MEKLIAVITGASSGIGYNIAKKLLENNYEIVALSRTDCGEFDNFIACDVGKKESIDSAFEQIKQKFGKVDLLINNAGYGISGALELASEEEVKNIFDVNTLGVVFCTNACLPLMKKGSKIINISSMCAYTPLPYRSLYCASKSAVNSISFGYRMELKNAGIDVCCVCPGDVKTNFSKNRVKNLKTNEKYGKTIENCVKSIGERESKRMDVSKVVNKIYKQIMHKKMRPVLIIGGLGKWATFFQRLIPTSWFLFGLEKIFINKK